MGQVATTRIMIMGRFLALLRRASGLAGSRRRRAQLVFGLPRFGHIRQVSGPSSSNIRARDVLAAREPLFDARFLLRNEFAAHSSRSVHGALRTRTVVCIENQIRQYWR